MSRNKRPHFNNWNKKTKMNWLFTIKGVCLSVMLCTQRFWGIMVTQVRLLIGWHSAELFIHMSLSWLTFESKELILVGFQKCVYWDEFLQTISTGLKLVLMTTHYHDNRIVSCFLRLWELFNSQPSLLMFIQLKL